MNPQNEAAAKKKSANGSQTRRIKFSYNELRLTMPLTLEWPYYLGLLPAQPE